MSSTLAKGQLVLRKRHRIKKTGTRRRKWWHRTTEEIYAYRTNKPGAIVGLPFFGRHWAYGGRTCDGDRRNAEHLIGGGRYKAVAKPWAKLRPRKFVLFKRKKRFEITTHLLEILVIRSLFCVYNVQYNLGNPRRIKPDLAKAQQLARLEKNVWKVALLSMRPLWIGSFAIVIIATAWMR